MPIIQYPLEKVDQILSDAETNSDIDAANLRNEQEQYLQSFLPKIKQYYDMGLCVLPQLPGEKRPTCKWKPYQDERPDWNSTLQLFRGGFNSWHYAVSKLEQDIKDQKARGAKTKTLEQDQACLKRLKISQWRWGLCAITGPTSGVVVVDFDSEGARQAWLQRGLPDTPWKTMTRKCAHYFYRYPQTEIKTTAGSWFDSEKDTFDIRAYGGLVVIPGGMHATGFIYEELGDWSQIDIRKVPVFDPTWLKDAKSKELKNVTGYTTATATEVKIEFTRQEKWAGQQRLDKFKFHDYMRRVPYFATKVINGCDGYTMPCPWEHEHSTHNGNEDFAIWEMDNGAIATKCLHSHKPKFSDFRNVHPVMSDDFEKFKWTPADVTQDVIELEPDPTKNYPLTDSGNALCFRDKYKARFLSVNERGTWLKWNDIHWETDHGSANVFNAAMELTMERAATLQAKDQKHWIKSQSGNGISQLVKLASKLKDFAATLSSLDQQHMKLNVLNGTIDLKTITLNKHDPLDRITKCCPVKYDPKATCPTFDKFIRQIMLDKMELVDFLQQWFGYCLTGDATLEYFAIFWGDGSNGKSTLINVIASILGEYAQIAPDKMFMEQRYEQHPTDVANLQGLRFLYASETDAGKSIKPGLIKLLTGIKITSRKMRQDLEEFLRTHKTVLMTNNLPRIPDDTDGMWRRILLVPFKLNVPREKMDTRLGEKLAAESSGILNWLLEGCMKWQKHGLIIPEIVQNMTNTYRNEEDDVVRFIADSVENKEITISKELKVERKRLYNAFRAWCETNKIVAMRDRKFYAAIETKGYTVKTLQGTRYFTGMDVSNSTFEGLYKETDLD